MSQSVGKRLFIWVLTPTVAAAIIGAAVGLMGLHQDSKIAEMQHKFEEKQQEQINLHNATMLKLKKEIAKNDEVLRLMDLELSEKLAVREQQLTLVGIVAEQLLSSDEEKRARAVRLLQVVDYEFAESLISFVEETDESPKVRNEAQKASRTNKQKVIFRCEKASWSKTSDESISPKEANAACQASISNMLRSWNPGETWNTTLSSNKQILCTCISHKKMEGDGE
ncbi:MAG: hypothetical protein JXR45_03760 [Deltaproteobacteria bacterium]|nr:hypothetical protein [Deltaproteobacteria bacterium]